jgi:hypothetical protein
MLPTCRCLYPVKMADFCSLPAAVCNPLYLPLPVSCKDGGFSALYLPLSVTLFYLLLSVSCKDGGFSTLYLLLSVSCKDGGFSALYLPLSVSCKVGGCILSTCCCLYPVKMAAVCCLPAAACIL